MKQQAEGSWIFRPTFLDTEEDVSGHHDGRVGYEGIEISALASFLQFQVLLCRAEEYFDVPAFAVNADNVFVGKGNVSGKQGQPVSLVLVAYEDELGFEAILELDLGIHWQGSCLCLGVCGSGCKSASRPSSVLQDIVDFGRAFDHADDGDVLAHIGDQGGHGEPTVHEQVLGLDASFESAFGHGLDQFRGFGHSLLAPSCAA
jgi:hypothetical protein